MNIRVVKTEIITAGSIKLDEFLDRYLKGVVDGSVVAITSKVVGIIEGRVLSIGTIDKEELIKKESEFYLPSKLNKFGLSFAINHHTLVPAAGIDESNGDGNYVLWPADPSVSANQIRQHLQRQGLKKVGVVITDSTARPLHYGTEGVAISYSGFLAMKNYIGQPDLFGRLFKASVANIPDALASAAVLVMGEGTERTPIAIIENVPFIDFQDRDPTPEELKAFYLEHMEDDLFAPFLRNMNWLPGSRNSNAR